VYHPGGMEDMRAGQLVERGRIEVGRFPAPEPEPGDVLVRNLAAAICGSDLHLAFGSWGPDEWPLPPGVPGHEGIGEVLESRSERYRPGDRVLTTPIPGHARGFAELQAVPGAQVVPVPADVDVATMLMAQQLGTVIYALKRFWPRAGGAGDGLLEAPGETATVLGAGTAGIHFTQLLKRAGFGRVVVSDLFPHRLAAARAAGADVTVLAPGESAVDATMDLTGGRGADLVVEAAGRDAARAQAVRAVAPGGRVGLFGLPEHPGDVPFPYAELFRRAPTITVSVGTQTEPGLASFHEAVRAIAAGDVEVSSLVTHRFGIEDLAEAFALAHERADGAIKVAITFD
jgi:L-iditol 2-dehydrogenase